MDKTAEYLRLLQEKNRLKKMMQTKSKDEQQKEELEKGFTTHFRGAHTAKESKMPVATKPTAIVKPLNIMGRIAKGANIMWGSERRNNDIISPRPGEDDPNENESYNSARLDPTDEGEVQNFNEYESDFDDVSDTETDLRGARANHKEARLLMPSVREGDRGYEEDELMSPQDTRQKISAPSSLQETVVLDSTLQTRVKGMSAQEKLKLLKLLEQDLNEGEETPPIEQKNTLPVKLPQPHISVNNNLTSSAGQHPHESADIDEPHVKFHTSSIDNNEMLRDECEELADVEQEDVSVAFRVRIMTSHSAKSKFVSLGAARLRVHGAESVDLLPLLSVKVISGLLPLPAASDCMRSLSQLIGGGAGASASTRRPASAYRGASAAAGAWKGPISSGSPLELQFTGVLPADTLDGAGLENLELLLWNCSSAPLNSACAKDVDIFVGSKCIWTGQLEEDESAAVTSTQLRPGELPPALSLFPWRTIKSVPSTSASGTPVVAPLVVKRGATEPTRSQAPATPTRIGLRTDSSKPDWLNQAQASDQPRAAADWSDSLLAGSPQRRSVRAVNSRHKSEEPPVNTPTVDTELAFGSPKKRVSAAGKRVSSALARSLEKDDGVSSQPPAPAPIDFSTVNDDDAPLVTGGSNSAAAKRRAARRDRNHLLEQGQAQGQAHIEGTDAAASRFDSNTGGFSPERSAVTKKQREAELRRSIDSMAFNDIHNLGRLSASKLPYVRSVIEAATEDEKEGEGEGGEDLLEQSAFSDEGPEPYGFDSLDRPSTPLASQPFASPAPLLDSPVRQPNKKVGPTVNSVDDAAARAARDSHRTAKIDMVQEKISSTIAGLAKIMSAIPPGGITLGRSESNKELCSDALTPPRPFPVRALASTTPIAIERSSPIVEAKEHVKEVKTKQKEVKPREVKPWHKKASPGAASTAAAAAAAADPFPVATTTSAHTLVLEILSNWGDANYVGLNGIELYDRTGRMVGLPSSSSGVTAITAFPKDLADLPEHRDDPRKVHNLLNGHNFTKNDLHSWLAPQVQVLHRSDATYLAKVVMEVAVDVNLAMCRIFNYNRSRTRNMRGARHLRVILDDNVLFNG